MEWKKKIHSIVTKTTVKTHKSKFPDGFLTIIVFAIKQTHDSFVRPFNGARLFFIAYTVSLFFLFFSIRYLPRDVGFFINIFFLLEIITDQMFVSL